MSGHNNMDAILEEIAEAENARAIVAIQIADQVLTRQPVPADMLANYAALTLEEVEANHRAVVEALTTPR